MRVYEGGGSRLFRWALLGSGLEARGSELASHKSRVQAACHCRIGCALDDGAAVREERHLVRVAPEFQDEVIVPDHAVGLKAAVHLGEVDGALPLMDLHGISAAEGNVRASFAGEMNEISFAAGAAAAARLCRGNLCVLVGPDIEGKKRSAECFSVV